VKAGETTSGGAFDVDAVYDLKQPGRYTIQPGCFDDETNIFMKSNKITITRK